MSASATASKPVTIADLEMQAEHFDVRRAAAIYREHGCLVVRGLMKPYAAQIRADIEAAARQAVALLPQAKKIVEGWTTPDGSLFLPAPAGFSRPQQIMLLPIGYHTSATFMRSALDDRLCDLASEVLGPDVELFQDGQVVYKEPVGGHAKHLHQDSSYFEHRYEGPMAALSYAVDTDLVNGALHVVPGSHRLGVLPHIDTFSHLGLDAQEWPWERAVPIIGKAGDTIIFHVNTIHGSKENRSQASRPVFIHRYRRSDDYVVITASTTENRAQAQTEAMKAAAAARRHLQRGLMVRGSRKWESDQQITAEKPVH